MSVVTLFSFKSVMCLGHHGGCPVSVPSNRSRVNHLNVKLVSSAEVGEFGGDAGQAESELLS